MRWSLTRPGGSLATSNDEGGDASELTAKRPRWCATTTGALHPSEPLNSHEERNS